MSGFYMVKCVNRDKCRGGYNKGKVKIDEDGKREC
jgi:hypothetical protein